MHVLKILLVISVLLVGCGKDTTTTPMPTTAEGKWTYTTPDKKIAVDFVLTIPPSGALEIQNPATIVVGGTAGIAAAQISDVSLPAIGSIRINANDPVLVQPYSILFNTCTVTGDFNHILVTAAEYTYPIGSIKTLTNITIDRKP